MNFVIEEYFVQICIPKKGFFGQNFFYAEKGKNYQIFSLNLLVEIKLVKTNFGQKQNI